MYRIVALLLALFMTIALGGSANAQNLAGPAYDAPPHQRKLDALLFTDDWTQITRGGYVQVSKQGE